MAGWRRKLGRWLAGRPPTGDRPAGNEPMGRRRTQRQRSALEAGETDRLNSRHWALADKDTPINTILAAYLPIVRARASYEAINNANVEGVINTHAGDVVGESGPVLQVESDNDKYNDALEHVWSQWWARPDRAGVLSGVDMLTLDVEMMWQTGEFFEQEVTDADAEGPVKLRLRSIHGRRCYTPIAKMGDESITLGIKRDRFGKPLEYYIETALEGESLRSLNLAPQPIRAGDIIHGFKVREPDQARGVPWLASSLQAIADLRDYDVQVMDAARAAADMAVLLYTKNPDADYHEVSETVEIERRMMTTLPPLYEAQQLTPQQPANTYRDFRAERLRELGRPVGMPLMMVQLDSRNHNFSSARFDSRVYTRALCKLQNWLVNVKLARNVRAVAREAELARAIPKRPERVRQVWTWPRLPDVDPQKEEKAVTERLKNETTTLQVECARKNVNWEDVLKQRAKEAQLRKELALPENGAEKTSKGRSDETESDTGSAYRAAHVTVVAM